MQAPSTRDDGATFLPGLAVLLTSVAAAAGLILSDGAAPDDAIVAAMLQDAGEQLVVASAE